MRATALLLIAIGASSQASAASELPIAACPAQELLPLLDSNYHECNRGFLNGSCEKFVDVFSNLTGRYDCRRSFDHDPVPAIWLSGSAATEDFVALLARLAESEPESEASRKLNEKARAKARHLFGSQSLRDVLDGDLAEQYLERSRRMGKHLE